MGTNRRTIVWFPVYNNFAITVILSQNAPLTSSRLRMRRKPGEDITPEESAAFLSDDDCPTRCWLVFDINDINEGIIAHESSHAIWHMLTTLGIKVDDENHSYHTGYLVDKIHKFLK